MDDDTRTINEEAPPAPLKSPTMAARALQPAGTFASTHDVLDAIDTMSRRIDDLARELNCLGMFDGSDDDRPRAA